MNAAAPRLAIAHLLNSLEYGTRKEDRQLTDRLLKEFGLRRASRGKLVKTIVSGPGAEALFLAAAREARPFALMLQDVYTFLSDFGTTAERRATVFRVSGAGARQAFNFDLENFPKEVLRSIAETKGSVDILNLRFGSSVEEGSRFTWADSATKAHWDGIKPVWDGDFYDNGFFRMLSYAGTVLGSANADLERRAVDLVGPVIEKLRALTECLLWPEFGSPQFETIRYMNNRAENFVYEVYPSRRAKLQREQGVTYLQHEVEEIANPWSKSHSSVVTKTIWDEVHYFIRDVAIAVHGWEKREQRVDRDQWLEKRLGVPPGRLAPEAYLQALEPLVAPLAEKLDELLETVRRESIAELQEALIEFFGLPFWKDRWFLYELWTLCRVLSLAETRWPVCLENVVSRADGVSEWALPGGQASAPVATIGATKRVECWTQRKTYHPDSGAGLEPDLRLTRSTPDHTDIVLIENKDRRKPPKGEIAEILQRYVTGTAARLVCLVNYESFTGPTHELPQSIPDREMLVLSRFRPMDEPAEFKLRLLEILESELEPVRRSDTAGLSRPAAIEVTLAWEHEPADLDLHAWIGRAGEQYHVCFSKKGSLDAMPFALLGDDVRTAPGCEKLTIKTDGLLRATLAVHRYSTGRLGDAVPSVTFAGTASGPHRMSISGDGLEPWWHVGTIDGADLSLAVSGILSQRPPLEA